VAQESTTKAATHNKEQYTNVPIHEGYGTIFNYVLPRD